MMTPRGQYKVNDYSIHPDHVINMDEVPLTFDLHKNLAVEKTGSSTISIKTTGHEKISFTCAHDFNIELFIHPFSLTLMMTPRGSFSFEY
jgi:hypothetical protein